jgi:hypothetical protein
VWQSLLGQINLKLNGLAHLKLDGIAVFNIDLGDFKVGIFLIAQQIAEQAANIRLAANQRRAKHKDKQRRRQNTIKSLHFTFLAVPFKMHIFFTITLYTKNAKISIANAQNLHFPPRFALNCLYYVTTLIKQKTPSLSNKKIAKNKNARGFPHGRKTYLVKLFDYDYSA